MERIAQINRRALLAAGVAAPLAIGATSVLVSEPVARPDLTLDRCGAAAWKWCSWRHDGESWRPVRGTVQMDLTGNFTVTGPLPPQDHSELVALLGEVAPGGSVAIKRML